MLAGSVLVLQAEIYREACVLADRLLSCVLSRFKLGPSTLWLRLALKCLCLLARCSKHRCLGSSPSSAQVPVLGTLPACRLCCYCGVMVPVNSINPAIAGSLALRSRVSHNHWMELTALEHRGSAKKGKEEFALFGLGKRLLAAAHLSR